MNRNTIATNYETGKAFEKINSFLDKKEKTIFYIILFLGLLLAILNFNARISEAHDDSLYIEAGYKYVNEFPNYYYTANAPLYPMFLGLLTLVFGTNLVVFKLFSILFYALGGIIFYKALHNKVAPVIKFFIFFFLMFNYLIIYYASQTFSESFYMLLQAIFFYYFFNYNFSTNPISTNIKAHWKQWLILGFLLMILTLAKNILLFGVVAVLLYYATLKEWKKIGLLLASFAFFKFLFEAIKSLVWGKSAVQYASQTNLLLNKDPYDASQGKEDLLGFFGRFTDNIANYVGKRFYQINGFMNEDFYFKKQETMDGNIVEVQNFGPHFLLAFIVLGLVFFGLYQSIKRKNYLFTFITLFAGTISFGTYFVLQARWDQARFVMVHMPALLLAISYGLYSLALKKESYRFIFLAFVIVFSSSFLLSSLRRSSKNTKYTIKNLKGDLYAGYTDDWKNYLMLSAYCNDSLPKASFVAARKAPMSFVYGKGKFFFPIYSVIAKEPGTNQSNPDSALAIFKKNKVTHLLIASLRTNPKVNDGNIINTLHNIAAPIIQKYPQKLVLVKHIGDAEPAELYELRYDN